MKDRLDSPILTDFESDDGRPSRDAIWFKISLGLLGLNLLLQGAFILLWVTTGEVHDQDPSELWFHFFLATVLLTCLGYSSGLLGCRLGGGPRCLMASIANQAPCLVQLALLFILQA